MPSVLYLGNNLVSKGSNPTYMGTLGKLLSREGYTVYYASGKANKLLRMIDMIWQFLRKKHKVSYVLIDTYSTQNFYYALVMSRLCRMFKKKYIPILHGGNLPARLENSPKFSEKIFKNAYKNVSPSRYLLEAFQKGGYDNVEFIPNAIGIDNYDYLERDIKDIRLLWVRSFSKIYNPKMAVRVLKELIDRGQKAKLCMVGPYTEESIREVKDLAHKLDVMVKFTGKLPKEEWITLSKNYNVFINTTNFDNMPISVIEAMALGLPIVSTNVGGLPYLIEDGKDGLLVEPDDHKSMADRIISLIDNETFEKKLIKNARLKVEQFNWDIIKHKWLDILK